jgi:hypothetical protein
MEGWLMDKFGGRKRSWPNQGYYPRNCLVGLRKTTQKNYTTQNNKLHSVKWKYVTDWREAVVAYSEVLARLVGLLKTATNLCLELLPNHSLGMWGHTATCAVRRSETRRNTTVLLAASPPPGRPRGAVSQKTHPPGPTRKWEHPHGTKACLGALLW